MNYLRQNIHRLTIWAIVIAFVGYMIALPTAEWIYESMTPAPLVKVLDEMSFADKVRLRITEGFCAFWFFAIGATIGSFLNVVAFRLPRGESVIFRSSRCPRCETRIQGSDNIPILGWLRLKGRCRTCRLPISIRYPIVEAIVACIFLLLFFVELISGGDNLPMRRTNSYVGVVWIIFYAKWDLIALYFYHCFAACVLLTWALIDIDRQRVPAWARWTTYAIIFAVPALYSGLFQVPWANNGTLGIELPNWGYSFMTSGTGGIVGAAVGWLVARPLTIETTKQSDVEDIARRQDGAYRPPEP